VGNLPYDGRAFENPTKTSGNKPWKNPLLPKKRHIKKRLKAGGFTGGVPVAAQASNPIAMAPIKGPECPR